ncbi:MAG: signal peptidase II [Thermodesulfovibrionales bacterium]|nr:signal peptidase II [Thermodesulfovibrionales bacterium]
MSQKFFLYFIIIFCIIFLDQLTKTLIRFTVSPYESIKVLPFLSIVYAENLGSAFGMFKTMGSSFFIILTFIAILFIGYLMVKENSLIYSIILGGAIGNLIDRVIYGYVIDFIDFHIGTFHWPAFNFADSALTVGILLLLYKTFRGKNTFSSTTK